MDRSGDTDRETEREARKTETRDRNMGTETRGDTPDSIARFLGRKKTDTQDKRSAAHRPNVTVRADVWCIRILMVYYCRISNTLCGKSELRMAELGFWSENRIFCNP